MSSTRTPAWSTFQEAKGLDGFGPGEMLGIVVFLSGCGTVFHDSTTLTLSDLKRSRATPFVLRESCVIPLSSPLRCGPLRPKTVNLPDASVSILKTIVVPQHAPSCRVPATRNATRRPTGSH